MLSDCDLLELDSTGDQMLVDFLTQTENEITTTQNVNSTSNVTTVQQNTFKQSSIPVIPWMYFPNSHITINYNFGK